MTAAHRPSQGKIGAHSRLETLQRLLGSSPSANQGRISKPQQRLGKATRLLPERGDHYERHIEEPLDEHGLADTAESAGEEGARDAWDTDNTIDQQHQELGLLPSENVNLDEAVWSALRKYV